MPDHALQVAAGAILFDLFFDLLAKFGIFVDCLPEGIRVQQRFARGAVEFWEVLIHVIKKHSRRYRIYCDAHRQAVQYSLKEFIFPFEDLLGDDEIGDIRAQSVNDLLPLPKARCDGESDEFGVPVDLILCFHHTPHFPKMSQYF